MNIKVPPFVSPLFIVTMNIMMNDKQVLSLYPVAITLVCLEGFHPHRRKRLCLLLRLRAEIPLMYLDRGTHTALLVQARHGCSLND